MSVLMERRGGGVPAVRSSCPRTSRLPSPTGSRPLVDTVFVKTIGLQTLTAVSIIGAGTRRAFAPGLSLCGASLHGS